MLNINRGHNEKLKGMCKSLKDYSEYTARVREYAQVKPVEEAVEQAISECIQEGILSEFLKQNRAEAKQVSIYEYDEEKAYAAGAGSVLGRGQRGWKRRGN